MPRIPRLSLVLLLAVPTLTLAQTTQPDLRPLLEIHASTLSTDSFNFSDQRITIYQGGALVYQARSGPDQTNQTCVNTTLALGTSTPEALRNLNQALRNGQVGTQRTCGLGTGFGTNLEYELEWTSPTRRMNRFEFGTFYRSGCPAGVAVIKDAVDRFVTAVLNDRRTRVIRSTCPR
jgi:hypothetical protein